MASVRRAAFPFLASPHRPMLVFLNAYVAVSLLAFLLHRRLARYRLRYGETAAWHRWHDLLHNLGHLLRIGLVLLAVYLLLKSAGKASMLAPSA